MALHFLSSSTHKHLKQTQDTRHENRTGNGGISKWLTWLLVVSLVNKAEALDPMRECPADTTLKNDDVMALVDLQAERRQYEALWKSAEDNRGKSMFASGIQLSFEKELPSLERYKELLQADGAILTVDHIAVPGSQTTPYRQVARDVLHDTFQQYGLGILGEAHTAKNAHAIMLQSSANTTAGITTNGYTVVHFDEIKSHPSCDYPNIGQIVAKRPYYYELPDLEGAAADLIPKLTIASSDLYKGKEVDTQPLWEAFHINNIETSPHGQAIKALLDLIESQSQTPINPEDFAKEYAKRFEDLNKSREAIWTPTILNTTQTLRQQGLKLVTLLRVGSAHAKRMQQNLKGSDTREGAGARASTKCNRIERAPTQSISLYPKTLLHKEQSSAKLNE